jgi:predicted dehydrogenase
MAQYGTKHSHAAGKVFAMQNNPDVELVGVYEPDAEFRAQIADSESSFADVRWFESAQEMLADPAIVAVASEGLNIESLDQTEEIVAAGKHVWQDKAPGDNWAQWQRVVAAARERELLIQMGYMLRYHDGFHRIAEWAKSGLLGHVFAIRAHMSTNIPADRRTQINAHRGGIFFELAGHMLDQIIWILGRPAKSACFLRTDDYGTSERVEGFADNTLGVFEFDGAMAVVDIAAMETQPMARRYEVYGTAGSAVIVEPFEPGSMIRLCLDKATETYTAGEQMIPFESRSRQELYDQELAAFLRTIGGQQEPDRMPEHDLLVQETLLRAVGHTVD